MNKEDKQKTLDYLKKQWEDFDKAGLKEEADRFKNQYYNLKEWGNINYSQYTKK